MVVCWIEGSWGSYFSYYNGPPTKNKPFDFSRCIRIAFSLPQTVPTDILADQLSTRAYLMEQCLRRQYLGLPVPSLDIIRKERSLHGAGIQGERSENDDDEND